MYKRQILGDPVVTGDLDPTRANTAYDGDTDIDLLTTNAVEAIAPGETFTVTFTAEIDPDGDIAALPLENVANAGGGGEGPFPSDPEPVDVTQLATSKDAGDPAVAASGTEGNVDVEYTVTVTNTGSVDADDITVTDDLASELGDAFVSVVATPTVVGDLVATRANTSFDGDNDINLLTADATETLSPSESVTITFTVELDPDADVPSLPLENVANSGGGGEGPFPSEPEPTPVPQLEDEKVIVSETPSATTVGATDITYAITVTNTGTEDINNLTLADDLATQFGTAFIGIVGDPVVTGDLATCLLYTSDAADE